ncbi:hypothetical protein V1477_000286, partial [Vespula maculifrons]
IGFRRGLIKIRLGYQSEKELEREVDTRIKWKKRIGKLYAIRVKWYTGHFDPGTSKDLGINRYAPNEKCPRRELHSISSMVKTQMEKLMHELTKRAQRFHSTCQGSFKNVKAVISIWCSQVESVNPLFVERKKERLLSLDELAEIPLNILKLRANFHPSTEMDHTHLCTTNIDLMCPKGNSVYLSERIEVHYRETIFSPTLLKKEEEKEPTRNINRNKDSKVIVGTRAEMVIPVAQEKSWRIRRGSTLVCI